MKILVASDLHLSDHIWKHRPIFGDSYHSWKQIVQLALTLKVDAIILAGDILDKQTNQVNPIRELLAGLRELTDANIPIWFNQGQHEYQANPWLELHTEGLTWLHTTDVTTPNGWTISGCDYQNETQLQSFLHSERAASADILVCHQVWKDFMGDVGKPQGKFDDIPDNVACLITGDYHEHIVRKHNNMLVLSPGSTHLRSVAEPAAKEVFLLTLGDVKNRSAGIEVTNLSLHTRFCGRVSTQQFGASSRLNLTLAVDNAIADMLVAAETYAKGLTHFPQDLRTPIIQVAHRTDEHDLVNQITAKYETQAHLFFKPMATRTEETDESILPYLDASDKVKMLDCLDNYVDKQQKPLVYDLALALLSSPDPEQALKRWIEEQTKEV